MFSRNSFPRRLFAFASYTLLAALATTATNTSPLLAPANTPSATPTNTPLPPTATPTATLIPTATAIPAGTTGAYNTTILADHPVLYYRLDEASGTTVTDSSGNGYNGSYTARATLGQPGATSDGDTAISVTGQALTGGAAHALPSGTAARSVEVWFKTTATPSSPYGSALVSWGTENTPQMFSLKVYSATQMKLTNWTNAYLFAVPSGANTLDGKWHHVVATYDGTNATIYYDGQSLGTKAVSFDTVNSAAGLVLGSQTGNNDSAFDGSLDEVAVYNKVLSAAQVQAHYNAANGSPSDGSSTGATPTATPPSVPPTATSMPAATTTAGAIQHYLYVIPDGTLYVYDMDNGFKLVKSISVPQTSVGVRGIAASPSTHLLYISYGGDGGSHGNGSMLEYDLTTDTVVWAKSYSHGIDSMTISPNGKTIYMPDGELANDGTWYVVDASSGNEVGTISGGLGPHNTIVSLNGAHVYVGGRNDNYLDVADTATNQVIKQIGPLESGVRPFTINGKETLAYTTATGFLGFQVSDITTGQVLYTVPISGFTVPATFTLSAPSHGISLSPDEKEVYVMDAANSYVHVFDVSGVPASAPKQMADIPLTRPMSGYESPCAYDCAKDGWVLHSRDGRYVFVGDSGDVIDTSTRKAVINLDTLYNTRKYLEIDFQNGVPVGTTTRSGLGYVTQ